MVHAGKTVVGRQAAGREPPTELFPRCGNRSAFPKRNSLRANLSEGHVAVAHVRAISDGDLRHELDHCVSEDGELLDVEVAVKKVGKASSPFGEELVLGRDFFPGLRWCDFWEHARLQR